MAILLGVDTGGTYTDAVLLRDETEVVAKAKALTTRHDLAEGVGAAIDAVLAESGIAASDIALVSLSTTLATNALVEGQGGRVGLVFIGFSEADLKRQGLSDALKGDPVLFLRGGHNHAGSELHRLDETGLREWLAVHRTEVTALAVASEFATRNPVHELRAQEIIQEVTGLPVSLSHKLASKLNGPKRAITAVLNARLIGMIDHLISASEALVLARGVRAPIMVVRGDGALISAEMARESPIETILSGPAASIVGARWLTDEQDALVSDIGGTTTDVALLRGGRPKIDPEGARVGPYRTMVEAVAMRTTGLGGDSEVRLVGDGLTGHVVLGPRRAMPISLLAQTWPEIAHTALDRQLGAVVAGEHDGRFAVPVMRINAPVAGLTPREADIFARIGGTACPLDRLFKNRIETAAFVTLVERGLVLVAAVTPSDASHALGNLAVWDGEAAEKALQLFARQKTGNGNRLASGAPEMARMIIDQLTEQTAETLLESAFDEDPGLDGEPVKNARHLLTKAGLSHHRGLVAIDVGLNVPVVGLGASAACYYGAVGDRLNTRMILPEHADVANAIGAVVGRVTMRETGTVVGSGDGAFRVYLSDGPHSFTEQAQALDVLEQHLRTTAIDHARRSGASQVNITVDRDLKTATIEGTETLLEATITVSASGRPRIAAE